jgi:4a-hydroxytetrahydrobiopterin dehydratase
MDKFSKKKCRPCQGGDQPLKADQVKVYMRQLDQGWRVEADQKLKRVWVWKNFAQALDFVNKVAELAEEEGHHPDICLFEYKKVSLELYTHKIGGLHENDFILASKIDQLLN